MFEKLVAIRWFLFVLSLPIRLFLCFSDATNNKGATRFIVCTLQVHICLSFLTSISKTSHVIIEIILSGRKQEDRNAKQNEWMRQQSLLYSMTNRTSEQLQGVVLTRGQKLFFQFFKEKHLLKWIIQSTDPSISEYFFGKLISFFRFWTFKVPIGLGPLFHVKLNVGGLCCFLFLFLLTFCLR